jgi:hypothetical protein
MTFSSPRMDCSAECTNVGAIPPLPIRHHDFLCLILMLMGNFTFCARRIISWRTQNGLVFESKSLDRAFVHKHTPQTREFVSGNAMQNFLQSRVSKKWNFVTFGNIPPKTLIAILWWGTIRKDILQFWQQNTDKCTLKQNLTDLFYKFYSFEKFKGYFQKI